MTATTGLLHFAARKQAKEKEQKEVLRTALELLNRMKESKAKPKFSF